MAAGLTSRERVLTALEHEQPDRVPADLWAEPSVWEKLIKILGKKNKNEVCEALHTDIRYIEPIYPPDTFRDGVRENMWGERWRLAETALGTDWQHVEGTLNEAQSIQDLERFPWPNCDQVDYSSLSRQQHLNEGYGIFFGNADFFERPALIRGIENFLVDTIEHPEWVKLLQKKFVDFFVEDFYRAMEETRGRIDVFLTMTDLGSQDRLLLSQQTREIFIYPVLRTLSTAVHREGVRMMFHTCGAIREVIPELIDCGVDILNPLQPGAKDMEPEGLKREFGHELVFHGAIDIQYLLPLESAENVRKETKQRIQMLGTSGGYILAPSHNLQEDIPLENITAMYDVTLRY